MNIYSMNNNVPSGARLPAYSTPTVETQWNGHHIFTVIVNELKIILKRIYEAVKNLFVTKSTTALEKEHGPPHEVKEKEIKNKEKEEKPDLVALSKPSTYLENPALIPSLAQTLPPSADGIVNTCLTFLLQKYVFGEIENFNEDKATLNKLLALVVKTALEDPGCEDALDALRLPNNPDSESEFSVADLDDDRGFPQNTPLCLLVKMGNLEGIETILPACDAKALLFSTPRNNSALHLAIATGQLRAAKAIMKRAQDLGVLDQLLIIKNSYGKTGSDIFDHIMSVSLSQLNLFKPCLDIINPLIGEELNKAICSINSSGDKVIYQMRIAIFEELKQLLPRFKEIRDPQKIIWADIFQGNGDSRLLTQVQ